MDPSFEYFRVGFTLGHYGRRGVAISVWHWGRWAETRELFTHVWYAFGRALGTLELLGPKEPLLCEYDAQIVSDELQRFRRVLQEHSDVLSGDAFRAQVAAK